MQGAPAAVMSWLMQAKTCFTVNASTLWDAFDSDHDSDGPIGDEHHAIFDCTGYIYAREQFQDLFQRHITTVSQFLNQPQCNRLAKFLTWIRACRMNKA